MKQQLTTGKKELQYMSHTVYTPYPQKWVKPEFLNLKRIMSKRSGMLFPREHSSVCIINMTNRY